MNSGKRIIYVVVMVMLCAICIWFVTSEKKEKKKHEDWVIADRNAVKELNAEKYELQQELSELEREYAKRMEAKSCVVLCFEQATSNLIEEVYPLLAEYGYRGVFVLDDVSELGKKGKITKEEYQQLIDAGWQAVTSKEKEEYIEQMGLNVEGIQDKEAIVKEALIQTINEGGSQLITTRYVGSASEDINVDCSLERYVNLLEWLEEYQQYLEVNTFEETKTYLGDVNKTKEEYRVEWQNRRQEIEERIAEIEELIEEAEGDR